MNLDDISNFRKLDTQDMIAHINGLPDQLQAAWTLGQKLPIPAITTGLRGVVIAGMGGSAIGADLLVSYAAPYCPVPVVVQRDYNLPDWAKGKDVLVVASSHSGNTEETLAAYEQARTRDCRLMVITTGGQLAKMGLENGNPVWQFQHAGQPRAAVGYSFGLLLAAFFRLGLLPDPQADLTGTLEAMRFLQPHLLPDIPTTQNPAKRLAGQLVGRWVTVLAASPLEPVARRWKGQISEIGKAWAQFEFLPEADHNTLAGLNNPEHLLSQMMALFLNAPSIHRRNQLRLDYTRKIFMTQGINTDSIEARGDNAMAHIWTLLHFGDYTSYYLAMAYGEDPTPVDALTMLKTELANAS